MIARCSTERAMKIQRKVSEALYEMLGEMPFDKITVQDLCLRAGLPRRSFYRYFENKKDVLDYVLLEMMQECVLYSMEVLPESGELGDVFYQFFTYWKEQKAGWLRFLRANHLEIALIRMFHEWLFEERRIRYMKKGISEAHLKTALTFALGGIMMILFQWAEDGYQTDPKELAKYASSVLTHSLYPM